MSDRVDDRALVVHLFVPVRQPRAVEQLRRVWAACATEFAMTSAVPGGAPLDLPDQVTGPVLAARQRPEPETGIFQAIVRRDHDVLALSVALAPAAGGDWDELESRWESVVADSADWALGEARLRTGTARWTDAVPPDRAATKVERHTAVWEDPGADGRVLRRLYAIAAPGREAESDAWLWTRGDTRFPLFAVHLLHAAKVRHQLRVRDGFDPRFHDLLDTADTLVARRHALPPDAAELAEVRQELSRLLSGPDALIQVASRLREMERTVQIAAANLRAVSGRYREGPLGDDLKLADWLAVRFADDLVYADAARDRASSTLGEVVQTAQESLQRRREQSQRQENRITLLQTAVTGSLIMILTAVQALGYRVPLPGPVEPAVIAFLGALALLLATLTLWRSADGSRAVRALVRGFVGLVCATASWVAVTAIVHAAGGGAAAPALTVGVGALAFVAGVLGAYVRERGPEQR